MIHPSSPYEACHELFVSYPLAVRAVNPSGTVRSMVLMVQDGVDARFFALSYECRQGAAIYSLWQWPAGEIAVIEPETSASGHAMLIDAVTRGIPIPRDGSMFGWTLGKVITALVVIYAEYASAYPEPGWTVMPLAGIPEAEWPPFTGEPLFGYWSWDQYRTGRMISLDSLIAGSPNTVCWVDTKAVLGSDCCAVAHDIDSPEGPTLRRGRYVYFQALRAGKAVPSLEELLADSRKIDLASRFTPEAWC